MSTMTAAMLHVRYNGQSVDHPLETVGLELTATDSEVKSRIASLLDVAADKLRDFVVDRSPSGFTVRPQAVFG